MGSGGMGRMAEAIFRLGMLAGRKQLEDHVIHQFEISKPAEMNGELYWLQDSNQRLLDMIDGMEAAMNDFHGGGRLVDVDVLSIR